ncbi:MAG: SUMF1/EgtB/PvdO family nonheme iron enzyme [Cyanobacteria bacterium P01_H01_bin.105]
MLAISLVPMSGSGSIFISYRRSDSTAETDRIYDRLVADFGPDRVFQDVDSIPLGIDFAEYLDQAVSQCQVVLVIIGKTWLTVTEPDGTRRLDNPDDFVRIEVESALSRKIPVIPVLIQGASMPRRPQLPESLQSLARRNGMAVGYNPRFRADMNRLIKGLKVILGEAVPSSSATGSRSETKTVYVEQGPKYDLRGAQFAGGFAEAVKGDQIGGAINNQNLRPSATKPQTPASFIEELGNDVILDMVYIPEGDFLMGSPEDEAERRNDEGPQHPVRVSDFYMGKYAVTQAQWKAVARLQKVEIGLETDPSGFKGHDLPVEQVSWFEAVEFCQRLSKYTGNNYRLPSEAEWEYACRAGTTTPFYFGETISTDQANYAGDYTYGSGKKGVDRGKTTSVGRFPTNNFGLTDMHGNVWEWCQDHWHENYSGAPKDSSPWIQRGDSNGRVIRGGSWFYIPRSCRSACRNYLTPGSRDSYFGFRVVCSAPRILL